MQRKFVEWLENLFCQGQICFKEGLYSSNFFPIVPEQICLKKQIETKTLSKCCLKKSNIYKNTSNKLMVGVPSYLDFVVSQSRWDKFRSKIIA